MIPPTSVHLHVEEWANRNVVQVKLMVGDTRETARSVGTIVLAISYWLRLAQALTLSLGRDFTRGECQHGCGHPSHLAAACDAGVFSIEGLPTVCACMDDRPGVI